MAQQITTATPTHAKPHHAPPRPRFLIISLPGYGHMNPVLSLADRLAHLGCEVTFLTSIFGLRKLTSTTHPVGISVKAFSDGLDDGAKHCGWAGNFDRNHTEFRRHGSLAMREHLRSGLEEGRPYSCLVHALGLSWVVDVAAEFDIPAAMLCVQAATSLVLCYYYFHGFGDVTRESSSSSVLKFPGLDRLDFAVGDLPWVFNESSSSFVVKNLREQFDAMDKETRAKVLVNTFDDLEAEALIAISNDKLSLIGIGPLIRSVDGSHHDGDRCVEWLDTKPTGSVVFVSFGSVEILSKQQTEEIAKGLLESGRPFLWVVRKKDEKEEEKLTRQKDLEELGMIVPWCSQVEILRHDALGCFVSHCGWNSTLESLVFGVPVVAFPRGVDQTTNAKLIEDVWKTGLRVKVDRCKELENNVIVGGEELKRCLELVMEGQEFQKNAKKWKELGRAAIREGGSSDKNLKAFVAEVIKDNN